MRAILVAAAILMTGSGLADAKPRRASHQTASATQTCLLPPTSDHDLLMRTVIGESRNEPAEGQRAVVEVILNRVADGRFGGPTVRGVLTRRKAFEPWGRRCRTLARLDARSPGWIEAMLAVNAVMLGGESAVANATHFANRAIVEARRNTRALAWIDRMANVRTIGRHTFGSSPEGRDSGSIREAHALSKDF